MAKRGMFTETKKALKKIAKGTNYFVQFADNSAYICEGHIVMKMPIAYYTEYILREIPGLPAYTEDKSYTGNKGILVESNINVKSFIDKIDAPHDVLMPKMIFDMGEYGLARAFTWFDGCEYSGALVNNTFYMISKDFTDGTYHCGKKNSPIYTSNGDLLFMMLPINYRYYDPFTDYIDTLNRANDVLSVKSNIAA